MTKNKAQVVDEYCYIMGQARKYIMREGETIMGGKAILLAFLQQININHSYLSYCYFQRSII